MKRVQSLTRAGAGGSGDMLKAARDRPTQLFAMPGTSPAMTRSYAPPVTITQREAGPNWRITVTIRTANVAPINTQPLMNQPR